MTQQKCLIDKGLLKEEIKQNKYIFILFWIINLCSSLLPAAMVYKQRIRMTETSYLSSIKPLLYLTNPLFIAILILSAAVFAVVQFRFLYKTDSLIFYNTMPLKKKSLFFTKFTAGFLSIVISFLPVLIINMVFGFSIRAYGLGIVRTIKVLLVPCLSGLFIYGVLVFAQMLSSQFFALVISAASILSLYPVIIGLVAGSIECYLKTYNAAFSMELATYLYPYFGAYDYSALNNVYTVPFMLYMLAAGIVMAFLSMLLFKKRKSENTNKFFSFDVIRKILQYYISTAFSIGVSFVIYSMDNDVWFTVIIGAISALVSFALMQAVFYKDIRKMFSHKKQMALIMVIVSAFNIIMINDILKLDDKLVSPKNTDSITIRMDVDNYWREITFKDKENIADTIEFIEKHRVNSDEGNVESINLTTPMYEKLGIGRHFVILSRDMREFVKENYDKKEFKENLYCLDFGDFKDFKGLSVYKPDGNGGFEILSKDKAKEVLSAIKSDGMKYSYDEIHHAKTVYSIDGRYKNYWIYIPIYDCFTDTIALIDEYIKESYMDTVPIK